jgi:hypothetical protein
MLDKMIKEFHDAWPAGTDFVLRHWKEILFWSLAAYVVLDIFL